MRARLALVLAMTLALGACATRPPPAPPPPPPAPPPGPSLAELKRQEDLKCLAETVYFEARGETEKGRQAVAWVVLNRVGHPKFPDSVCGVVRQGGEKPPCQFSWYCDGKPEVAKEQSAWAEAERVAALVYDRKVPDPTHGALYFHHVGVKPSWKDEFQQTARIDGHLYYKPLNISQI
ncbi:MAG TPA: cell wall hydrolase [Azospirillaceae bacterium]|nr:cell wall hydrolase [Azospirillaceae bacterium]